jgi:hypothetical protein
MPIIMNTQTLTSILETLDHVHYHPEWRLLAWHPRGLLDDEVADEIVSIVETQELFEDATFNRYTDFSGLHHIRLKIGHVFEIAEQRRPANEPAKSAFFADTTVGFGIARMYEELMKSAIIQVCAFRSRTDAAEWLGVPVEILKPGSP